MALCAIADVALKAIAASVIDLIASLPLERPRPSPGRAAPTSSRTAVWSAHIAGTAIRSARPAWSAPNYFLFRQELPDRNGYLPIRRRVSRGRRPERSGWRGAYP